MADEIKLEFGAEVPAPEFAQKDQVLQKTTPEYEDSGYMESINLTEEEKQMVTEFADQIDLNNTGAVLVYGAASQKKISDFSDKALEGVRTKDLGEIGNDLAALVAELKGFSVDTEEPKGLAKIFKKTAGKAEVMKARYDKAEKNVDGIVRILEGHQNKLTEDIVMLDKMYDTNLVYLKELTMYILAGKEKLEKERSTTLVQMQKKAQETGLAEDAQAASDFAELCSRFEKKIYDLELSRTISIQMAPQIRMVQNNDTLMTEKIQSTIVNAIPLWKNQMVLALSMENSLDALKAQQAAADLTNELLQKNSEALKEGSVQIAGESERGIVDIETLEAANTNLIETLDEVIRIQEEGREKRAEAEQKLGLMEAELKHKLLDIRTSQMVSEENDFAEEQ